MVDDRMLRMQEFQGQELYGDPKSPVELQNQGIVGSGRSFASFGEIVQGRLPSGQDFLVTLPVNLWSRCHITCTPTDGGLSVKCEYPKSRALALTLLNEIGIHSNCTVDIKFDSQIPIGKGLSSSTADLLALTRAFEEAFNVTVSQRFVSRVFSEIEPHDALHYSNCVAYDHRSGELLDDFGYIPQFKILAVDTGGVLDTVSYNKKLLFGDKVQTKYGELMEDLSKAFMERDDRAIGSCAYRSTLLHAEQTNNAFLFDAMRVANNIQALGLVNTHSGTCVGFLFSPSTTAQELKELKKTLSERFSMNVFETNTLPYLD